MNKFCRVSQAGECLNDQARFPVAALSALSRSAGALPLCLFLALFLCPLPTAGEPDAAALLQNGLADKALQELNSQVQKNPDDAQAYNLLSRVYFQLEHWDESIRAAERSVALAPQNSEYHQWLARAYGRKAEVARPLTAFGLVRRVKAEFEKAVALDDAGKNLSARVDLAEFYMEAPYVMGGDKNKARKLAEFVMKRDAALGHYMMAELEEKQNAKDRAEQEYKAAIAASGNDARYWVSLAGFYRRTGRPSDMEDAINKSLTAQRQDGIPLFDGASCLLTGGRNFSGAVEMLRHYLALDDPAEDGPAFRAHYVLGVLLEKLGDTKAASAEFRAALTMAAEYKPAQDALSRLAR